MPNWCDVRIRFDSEEDRIKAEPLYKGKNAEGNEVPVTFNVVVPMPSDVYRGPLGPKERELYGDRNWYDWRYEHWGTKWDAVEPYVRDNEVRFQTAWCPPEAWFKEFSKRLEAKGLKAHADCWTEGCGSLEDACDGYRLGVGGFDKEDVSEDFLESYKDWYIDEDEDEEEEDEEEEDERA